MPIPSTDVQVSPSRADLAATLAALDAKVDLLAAAVLNTQAAVEDVRAMLLAAGVEPGVLTAILGAARTD